MVTRLLLIALVLFSANTGWQFASPPVKKSLLEGKMKDLAKNRGRRTERQLRRDILEFSREKDIPLREQQLMVTIDNNGVEIAAKYNHSVNILGYSHVYHFDPATSDEARNLVYYRHRNSR